MAAAVARLFQSFDFHELPDPSSKIGRFNPHGIIDITLPGLLLLHFIGLTYREMERRTCRVPGKTTYIAFVGFIARVGLCLLPIMPLDYVQSRWDWLLFLPTHYEILAHLYHWHDTPSSFKRHLFGHHGAVMLWWPVLRAFEVVPYPTIALPIAVLFEAASGWSDAWYVVVTNGPDMLGPKHASTWVPALVHLCFAGQRFMRWTSLLLGIPFVTYYGHVYRYVIWAFSLPAVLFELYCIRCQVKTLRGGVCFS